MTEDELIEKLARAACVADGRDPDAWVETGNFTTNDEPIKMPLWSVYCPKAHSFLAMMKAYEEAKYPKREGPLSCDPHFGVPS